MSSQKRNAETCLLSPTIGRKHMRAQGNPYKVCLTENALRTLFPATNTKGWRERSIVGNGTFARVWSGGPGKVIKITNDETDVLALRRANAAKIAGVPKLYAAYRLATPTTSKTPVYALVVEGLSVAAPGRVNAECLGSAINDGLPLPPSVGQLAAQCCSRDLATDANLATWRKDRIADCKVMAAQLRRTLVQLHRAHIPVYDIHEDNVGRDAKGNWKLLDLGLSAQARTGKVAPTLRGPRKL